MDPVMVLVVLLSWDLEMPRVDSVKNQRTTPLHRRVGFPHAIDSVFRVSEVERLHGAAIVSRCTVSCGGAIHLHPWGIPHTQLTPGAFAQVPVSAEP